MGCGKSKVDAKVDPEGHSHVAEEDDPSKPKPVQWRDTTQAQLIVDIKRYQSEGTLTTDNPQHLELRAMLDDPIGQRHLSQFAKASFTNETFFAWVDLQEFKVIPTKDYRRCMAKHIFAKYIKAGAVLEVGGLAPHFKSQIEACITEGARNSDLINKHMFDAMQDIVFKDMFQNTYLRFKASDKWKEYKEEMRSTYNSVRLEDFDYIRILGEGGFGRVVHVVKKSTRHHYAMKIQLKSGLVETYWDDPTRLDCERNAFALCHHPFIVDMHYAFQTPAHAILVLALVTGGDLQEAIDDSPNRRVDEQRVQLYVAEICLALLHLHEQNLMYRDLKPCNVLLCDSGHVQLADMGGVADFGVDPKSHKNAKKNDDGSQSGMAAVGEDATGSEAEAAANATGDFMKGVSPKLVGNSTELNGPGSGRVCKGPAPARRTSIMGTRGYMAPEMVKMRGQRRRERRGYTFAVDYWSLGVTAFKLLTGSQPFHIQKTGEVISEFGGIHYLEDDPDKAEYYTLLQGFDIPDYISPKTSAMLRGFLDLNEDTRLGCAGADAMEAFDNLRQHEYFEGIDWDKLSQRHVIPSFIPPVKQLEERPLFQSYDDMMQSFDAADLDPLYDWAEEPTEEDQKYFENWDFISPHTLKIEMGIGKEMEQHDTNFKVQQLMG